MITESQNLMKSDGRERMRLALALIDSLGPDGAIFACRANGWDGVLDLLVGAGRADARRTTPAAIIH